MTIIVQYHSKTREIALLKSDDHYWVGTYSPYMTHQNGEPLFVFYSGYYENESNGLIALTITPETAF